MEKFRFDFKALGCGSEILVVVESKGVAITATEAAVAEITRIEQKYSRYQTGSLISRLNDSAGADGFLACDEETASLLRHADDMYVASSGLFDVTSGVMRRAWDFNRTSLPDKKKIERLLELIGWNKVERDGNSVRLSRKGMQLDLGGIGKEYAADRAAEVLHGKGIRHGYVNMAGDIRVVGVQPDGQPWKIGVRDPLKSGKMLATVPLYGGALATSGDYERCIVVDGRQYGHIINPLTGYPVDYWRSVSVVAPTALQAGSCSTIVMLKEKDGLDHLNASGLMYLAVDKYGKIHHRD
jgi:thiamine biosynthesis lipoprotein